MWAGVELWSRVGGGGGLRVSAGSNRRACWVAAWNLMTTAENTSERPSTSATHLSLTAWPIIPLSCLFFHFSACPPSPNHAFFSASTPRPLALTPNCIRIITSENNYQMPPSRETHNITTPRFIRLLQAWQTTNGKIHTAENQHLRPLKSLSERRRSVNRLQHLRRDCFVVFSSITTAVMCDGWTDGGGSSDGRRRIYSWCWL